MHPAPSPQRQHRSQQLESLLAFLLIAYFAGKTIWLALKIGPGIFPDEETWFGISRIFSHSLLPPADSQASYQYGLITHVPTLYFWLMGRLLHGNIFGLAELTYLRLCNVAMGLATVYCGWRSIRLITENILARLLFLVFLTNTLMFTFLTAGISYDNLTNLLAAASLLFLLQYFAERQLRHLLLMLLSLCLGGLTKTAFLPFAFLLLLAWLAHFLQTMTSKRQPAVKDFSLFAPANLFLVFCCLVTLLLNLRLYAGNLLRYHHLTPTMDQVLPIEQALQYRIFARNYITGQFRQKRITLQQAQRLVFQHIKNPGDREDALALLQTTATERQTADRFRLDRFRYALQWIELISTRTFGIAAHILMPKSPRGLLPYYLVFLVAAMLFIRHYSFLPPTRPENTLLLLSGGYALIVMQLVNYTIYNGSGLLGLALTGRYLFPVIIPFYGLAASYLLAPRSKVWQWGAFTLCSLFFITAAFPWFLAHITPAWYAGITP